MNGISYRKIESPRRRHIAFRLAPDGVLEVRAPLGTDDALIEKILAVCRSSIEKLKADAASNAPCEIGENVRYFYRGVEYHLQPTRRLACFDGAFLLPEGGREERLRALEKIYRDLAARYILPRARFFAEKFSVSVKKLSISGAATRHGSCSSSGNCAFSWRLIQYPDEMIDYVICHELAHRFVMNHSPKFYAVLERFFPGAREMRKKITLFSRVHKLF